VLVRTAARLKRLAGPDFAAEYVRRMQAGVVSVRGVELETLGNAHP
jgi:hypothetical protein